MSNLAKKIIQGPWGDQVTSEHIDKAANLKPKKPALTKRSSEIWDIHAPEMVFLDRLKPRFVFMFAEWCYQVSRIESIREQLEQIGYIYEVENRSGVQLKCHPLVGQMHEHFRQMMTLTLRFGLTPSDEKNLIKSAIGESADEFSKFKD